MKTTLLLTLQLLATLGAALAQDPGWPRQMTQNGSKLVYYQPQFDNWSNEKQIEGRMAISLTPSGGKPVVGVVALRAQTDVNLDAHTVRPWLWWEIRRFQRRLRLSTLKNYFQI